MLGREYNSRFDFSIPSSALATSPSPTHLLLSSSLRDSRTFELYADVLTQFGSRAVFLPFEIAPQDENRLAELMRDFRRSEMLQTIMVSDPFKQRVQPYIDELTDRATNAQAVNLVTKSGSQLIADNLDGIAFELGLKEIDNTELIGQSMLFFGCGGVSSAIAAILACQLCRIGLADVNEDKAEILRCSLARISPGVPAEILPTHSPRNLSSFNVLYNGTGLGKGLTAASRLGTPLADDDLTNAVLFIDAIYTPTLTRFLQQGADRGARSINGLSHMLASTALHCSIITGHQVSLEMVARAYHQTDGQ